MKIKHTTLSYTNDTKGAKMYTLMFGTMSIFQYISVCEHTLILIIMHIKLHKYTHTRGYNLIKYGSD